MEATQTTSRTGFRNAAVSTTAFGAMTVAGPAMAVPIYNYTFSGTINSVSGAANAAFVGSNFSGNLTFTPTADVLPGDLQVGAYNLTVFPGSVINFQGAINVSDWGAVVLDDLPDDYLGQSYFSADSIDGAPIQVINFDQYALSTLFSGDNLITAMGEDYSSNNISFNVETLNGAFGSYFGTVNDISFRQIGETGGNGNAVPETGTLALALVAIAAATKARNLFQPAPQQPA